MLVFGDAAFSASPRGLLHGLERTLRHASALPAGIDRHAALVGALVDGGALLQGVADAETGNRPQALPGPGCTRLGILLHRIARAVRQSWQSGFAAAPLPAVDLALAALLPATARIRQAEGFAFYALYPETYLAAARAAGLGACTRVVGIRSIGVPLAAMVAAGLGARPALSVRPGGPALARSLALGADWLRHLVRPGGASVAVVDEGPGLSGSSFAAVAEALEAGGLAPGRLVFFPGHAGPPGPHAAAATRARWLATPRHVVPLAALTGPGAPPAHRLATWFTPLVGSPVAPLRDISVGRWRALREPDPARWPPVHVWQQRMSLLVQTARGTFLARFAGLGAAGAEALARARALHAAGFAPEVAGLAHGFLLQRWQDSCGRPAPAALTARVGDYLRFRARAFPAGRTGGARLATLLTMARRNTALALGDDAARQLGGWTTGALDRLERTGRPVVVDGALHASDWITGPSGTPMLADALSHHAPHDLVGAQDIAWDCVGASVELGLDAGALAEQAGAAAPLLPVLHPCYLAFKLGLWTMAADAAPDLAERARAAAAAARHRAALARLLGA